MSRVNNKRPFNCVRSRKRLEHHRSRGSGMEKMQRQVGWVLCLCCEGRPRGALPPKLLLKQTDLSWLSHSAARVHRMFLPELTNEMWINCRDGMVPVASYERTHMWHGTSVSPNWSQVTAGGIMDDARRTTYQPSISKEELQQRLEGVHPSEILAGSWEGGVILSGI